jgi:nitrite reductase/ring-hydroxylating ferredoxin subunit
VTQARARATICRADKLAPGERRISAVDGVEIGVFNVDGTFVAYRNYCPHQGAPVCRGRVGGTTLPSAPGHYVYGREGRILHCPWHGWQFDLESGEALGHSARLAPVQAAVEDGMLVVYVPTKASPAGGSEPPASQLPAGTPAPAESMR